MAVKFKNNQATRQDVSELFECLLIKYLSKQYSNDFTGPLADSTFGPLQDALVYFRWACEDAINKVDLAYSSNQVSFYLMRKIKQVFFSEISQYNERGYSIDNNKHCKDGTGQGGLVKRSATDSIWAEDSDGDLQNYAELYAAAPDRSEDPAVLNEFKRNLSKVRGELNSTQRDTLDIILKGGDARDIKAANPGMGKSAAGQRVLSLVRALRRLLKPYYPGEELSGPITALAAPTGGARTPKQKVKNEH